MMVNPRKIPGAYQKIADKAFRFRHGGHAPEKPPIMGHLAFPETWTVFAPLEHDDPLPDLARLATVPETITVGERILTSRRVKTVHNQLNFAPLLDDGGSSLMRAALVFVTLDSEKEQTVTLGLGADFWVEAWLNGERIMELAAGRIWPPVVDDFRVLSRLRAGMNLLVVRFVAGRTAPVLALGGPAELQAGKQPSIAYGPLFRGDDLRCDYRPAAPGDKPLYAMGSRLEMFVDDFLVDALAGGVDRRLHHPVPCEVIMEFGDKGMPWEKTGIGYRTVIQDDARILLYYNPHFIDDCGAERQVSCVIESADGIHFNRPDLNIHEIPYLVGGKTNNVVWPDGKTTHNFTPFLDQNPATPAETRFKATGYHPSEGLGVFGSPDGIHWRLLNDAPIVTEGGFDSQNLAFWDPPRQVYACYMRNWHAHRDIRFCVSPDFIHWSEPEPVVYTDDRREHMYTNGIRPYFRAPHILIGTPNRFVPTRVKVPGQGPGINDGVLMSSRDGRLFDRWEEAFIRPGLEPGQWTNRNYYPTPNTVQTSPTELSLYWNEHNRLPTARLRRGTLRLDGFASLHAGGAPGEMLTRPLVFDGKRLVVNYATSAAGALRFELCDKQGAPLEGFTLADSEELFGNDVEHTVSWQGGGDLGALAGRPVRLRVRLHDADLYSIRFAP